MAPRIQCTAFSIDQWPHASAARLVGAGLLGGQVGVAVDDFLRVALAVVRYMSSV